jgi:hypothetical protein
MRLRRFRAIAAAMLTLAIVACGSRGPASPNDGPDDPGGGGGNGEVEDGIVGTWDIVSVDGAPVTVGSLRWVFTVSAYSALTAGCIESGTYAYAADTLRATTTEVAGEACTGVVGEMAEYEVTVNETTLTAIIPDVETEGSSTFIFLRV